MPATTSFETKTCTRCGGSGKYSYCQMYGSTCFQCHGSGSQLTKRGRAAADFLRALRTVKGSDVKLGDCVLIDGIPGMSRTTYIRVETIYTQLRSGSHFDPSTKTTVYCNHLNFCGKTPKGEEYNSGVFPDSDVRLVPTKALAAEQLAKALAYQATLTQAGTVAKRARAAQQEKAA